MVKNNVAHITAAVSLDIITWNPFLFKYSSASPFIHLNHTNEESPVNTMGRRSSRHVAYYLCFSLVSPISSLPFKLVTPFLKVDQNVMTCPNLHVKKKKKKKSSVIRTICETHTESHGKLRNSLLFLLPRFSVPWELQKKLICQGTVQVKFVSAGSISCELHSHRSCDPNF